MKARLACIIITFFFTACQEKWFKYWPSTYSRPTRQDAELRAAHQAVTDKFQGLQVVTNPYDNEISPRAMSFSRGNRGAQHGGERGRVACSDMW